MKIKILSIAACLCIIILCVFLGPTGVGAFIDPPSFLIVFLITWFILIAAYGFENFFKMFGVLSGHGVSRERARIYQSIAKSGILVSVFTGFLGTLIGCVQMLSDLSDPDYLGVGLATALLTLFYGVLQALFIFLPIYGAAKTNNESEEHIEKYKDIDSRNPFRLIALGFMTLICVGTLTLCVIGFFFAPKYEYSPELNNYVEFSMEMTFSVPNSEGKNLVLGITFHTDSYKMSALVEDPNSGGMSLLRPIQAEFIDIVYSKFSKGIELTKENQKLLAKEFKLSTNKLKNELAPYIPGQVLRVYFYRFHYE